MKMMGNFSGVNEMLQLYYLNLLRELNIMVQVIEVIIIENSSYYIIMVKLTKFKKVCT